MTDQDSIRSSLTTSQKLLPVIKFNIFLLIITMFSGLAYILTMRRHIDAGATYAADEPAQISNDSDI